ncbi:MAG: hypothetical protein COU31_03075 [Candidatus Magasanikbacteria bacterium CG10_big_fil_rev_8_21_14_0_10_40_10]|uniref:HlyC/CorC family transporter n=1 Tax=Candidatus Magasanikbacteria bacterium CG10_big_fil_rev_8_21_14_0_10_40_10 TaxID=1974648 RepID=A0A2M6W3Q8_9BACT|nr:MAG: hypothetical protein COU31_03075 [Candidatus Magasanikbacteria bacterium CG10_big_fil_rev_8_21_14_0_10_40_10]
MFYYLLILTIVLIILIYLSAWFSGAETALTNLGIVQIAQIRQKQAKAYQYIAELKRNMDRTLVAILIGNNVVNILLSAISALIANQIFHSLGVSLIIGLVTFLLVVFGEILPKSKSLNNSVKLACKNASKIYYYCRIIRPVADFFLWISKYLMKMTGHEFKPRHILVSDDNIKGLVSLAQEQGVLKKIEKDIIHKVFHFGDSKIRDIVVPLNEVYCLNKNLTIGEARKEVVEHGFTRVPVVNETGRIIGVLYGKDLMAKKDGPIDGLIKKPFLVGDDDDITDIFDSMKNRRTHIAIVHDSKTKQQIGIVTMEDIIEELVGEIFDEFTHLQEK